MELEKLNIYKMSFESKTWLYKSYKRKLISEKKHEEFIKELNRLGVKLNNFISVNKKNFE
ncbi:hypothetical protein ACFLTI_08650 [Bacteroidota bacterium]